MIWQYIVGVFSIIGTIAIVVFTTYFSVYAGRMGFLRASKRFNENKET